MIPSRSFPCGSRDWLPIDDTHISVIQYRYHPEQPLTEAEIQASIRRQCEPLIPAAFRLLQARLPILSRTLTR